MKAMVTMAPMAVKITTTGLYSGEVKNVVNKSGIFFLTAAADRTGMAFKISLTT
ncbi:hypothetical protein [Duffyella gerundensis]|uniref:hypothetical protein n=1 Tax=Duffyella TaxID=3026546 RepID=UPI003F6E2382